MSYGKIGEGVVALVMTLIATSCIGLAAIVYTAGHLLGYWA